MPSQEISRDIVNFLLCFSRLLEKRETRDDLLLDLPRQWYIRSDDYKEDLRNIVERTLSHGRLEGKETTLPGVKLLENAGRIVGTEHAAEVDSLVDEVEKLPPRVFISYSHDSDDHATSVLHLADSLRANGIDATLDQYIQPGPGEGWPRWMERNIDEVRYILMVCTETYCRRVMNNERPGEGRGVRWEGGLIYGRIYNDEATGSWFVPILLPGSERAHIPNPVQGHSYYRITTFDLTDPGYEALYRHLTDQPRNLRPVIGQRRTLPPGTAQLQTRPPLPLLQVSGKPREQLQVDQPTREDSHTETTMQGKPEPDKPQHCPSGRSDSNNVLDFIVKNVRNGTVVPVLGPSINRNIYINLADHLVKLVTDWNPPVKPEEQIEFIRAQYGSPCSICHLLPGQRPPECPLIAGLSSSPDCPIYQEHMLSVAKTNCRILSQLYESNSNFSTLYDKLSDCIIESSKADNPIYPVLARLLKDWRAIGSRVQKPPALPFPVIITTNFDAGLERVFDQERIPFDLVWRVAAEDDRGEWRHLGFRAQERVILPKPEEEKSKKYDDFPLGKRTTSRPAPEPRVIIIKAFGSINDQTCERVSNTMQEGDDYYLITQDQMESFLGGKVQKLPEAVLTVIRDQMLLFLGFSPNDPELRAIVDQLYGKEKVPKNSWIIHECEPGTLDQKIWKQRGVELLRVDSLEQTMIDLEDKVRHGSRTVQRASALL